MSWSVEWVASVRKKPAASALPSLVEFALSAMSILYGGLLGIFATGFLSRRRGRDGAATAGLAIGGACGLLLFLQPLAGGEPWMTWGLRIPFCAAVAALVTLSTSRAAGPAPTAHGPDRPL